MLARTLGCFLVTLLLALAGCKGTPSHPPHNDGGVEGEGGCSLSPPVPLFTVTITAEDGSLPPDTTIAVDWSAGAEPPFVLADPATWRTLDDGANVVCDVDRSQPPPTNLDALVCELWTSGATDVRVEAMGYAPQIETLTPDVSEKCGGPMPRQVALQLKRELPEAGPLP